MRLSPVLVVCATAATLVACSKFTLQPPNAAGSPFIPKQIWSGASGGFTISWTTADIMAFSKGSKSSEVFSEIGRTIGDFHAVVKGQTADCDMTRQADLQSVVGSIISIRTNDTMKCQNGATGTGRGAVAIDLTHPRKPVTLSDVFPRHELSALGAKAEHFCTAPPRDLFSRFAFSEYHGQTVIVAVTLPPTCSEMEVDLALNAPAALKQPLLLAAQGKQGFLWHNQATIANGLVTTVNYHYRTAVQ